MVRRVIRDTLQGLLLGESTDALLRERDAWRSQAIRVQHEYMALLEQNDGRADRLRVLCESMLTVLEAQGGYVAPEHQALVRAARRQLEVL